MGERRVPKLSKAEEELQREILAASDSKNRTQCIEDLERLYARATREGHLRAALVALQLLQPQLVLAGMSARAQEVDRLKDQLYERPEIRALFEAPIPPTMQALIDRATSPTCVYLAVDIGKAAEIRVRKKRVARLQLLKRKARKLGCEATTMKALELLRGEFKRPIDARRLARVEAEIVEIKNELQALRAKAEAES